MRLKHIEQSIRHDPPNHYGNCAAACYAILLGLRDSDSVPNYSDPRLLEADGHSDHHAGFKAWLSQYNLTYVTNTFDPPADDMKQSLSQLLETFRHTCDPGGLVFCFAHNRLGRKELVNHSIVINCGPGDIHDPSPLGGHYEGWDASEKYLVNIKGISPCTDSGRFWVHTITPLPGKIPKLK